MLKKPQFKEPSKAAILSRKKINYVNIGNVAYRLLTNDDPRQVYILKGNLNRGFTSSRKFRKHAPELRLFGTHLTLEEARDMTEAFNGKRRLRDRSVPLYLRENAVREFTNNGDRNGLASGFLWHPIKGRDKRARKVSLYHTVDGHRIFANGGVEIKPYDAAMKVEVEGACVKARVPSMTQDEDYELVLERQPVIDNNEQFVIGSMFYSQHQCGDKQFNIRYKYADDKEDSKLVNICKHEVAAQLGVIEYYFNGEDRNYIPLKNSFVPLLSRKSAFGACRALDSLLIFDKDVRDDCRRPRAGELEAVYWLLVFQLGAKNALYSSMNIDGKIKNYNWTLRN